MLMYIYENLATGIKYFLLLMVKQFDLLYVYTLCHCKYENIQPLYKSTVLALYIMVIGIPNERCVFSNSLFTMFAI